VGLSRLRRPWQAQTPPGTLAYNPKPLEGYAVLVDYFNHPEVVTQVRQLLGTDVGLVSGNVPTWLFTQATKKKLIQRCRS